MGGTIGVESEEFKGSKFTFTIPLELDASAEEGDKPPVMCNSELATQADSGAMSDTSDDNMTSSVLPTEAKRRRVLVVDRHEMTKQVLCDQIRAWRMDSLPCSSGRDAIGILRNSFLTGAPFHGMLEFNHNLRYDSQVTPASPNSYVLSLGMGLCRPGPLHLCIWINALKN